MSTNKESMMNRKCYLIYRASEDKFRVTSKVPRLALDEVAFPITVVIPGPWGRIMPGGDLQLPPASPALLSGPPIGSPSPDPDAHGENT